MSFRSWLSWKHYALLIVWPLLSYASNPVAFDSPGELAGGLIAAPLVILAGLYVWYAIRHKQPAEPSNA